MPENVEPTVRLDSLRAQESAVLCGYEPALDASRRERFEDLGLVPLTPLILERRAPLGDPLVVRVRGTLLCLRRDEARFLNVRRTA